VPIQVSVAVGLTPLGGMIGSVGPSSPSIEVAFASNTSQTVSGSGSVFFPVLPGYFYEVSAGNGTTLVTWAEWK